MSRNESVARAKNLLVQSSAIAAIMSGFGPKPVLAPPDDLGAAAAAAAGAAGGDKGGAPDKGGGGDGKGAPTAGGSGGGDGKAAGADAAAAASAGTAYRPAGLPDHLLGAKNEETIDKLYNAVNGFRDLESKRGAVPKEANLYGFQADDALKPYVANFDKDPLYNGIREDALASGLTDKEFGAFIPKILKRMVDGGMVDKPVDAAAQLIALAPEGTYANDKDKATAAGKRVTDNIAWADGAKAQKSFGAQSDAIGDFLAAAAASDPRAHHLIEHLKGLGSGGGPNLGGGGGAAPGGYTEAGYNALLAERDKHPTGTPDYKAKQAEITAYGKKLWGEGPAA